MNSDKIKLLLEKYYKGETSLEEEAQLREALKPGDHLADDLQPDAELFKMMSALSSDSSEAEPELDIMEKKVVFHHLKLSGWKIECLID